MWSREFWRATAERVIRAFAVAFLATLGTSATLDLRGVDWRADLAVAGAAALLNLLVSLAAGAGIGPKGSPSLVRDPAAAAPADPVVALADRDARRSDPGLAERLETQQRANLEMLSDEFGGSARRLPAPTPPPVPDPGISERHGPGEHRKRI